MVWTQLICSSVSVPQAVGTHGTCIFGFLCWEDALHLAQLGFTASNGKLGETWPLSALGLPTPRSQRDVVVAKFLWYISAQNRMVSSDSLKSFWTTGVHWARSKTIQRNLVVFLGKASLGLQLWLSGPQPFLPVSSWFVGMTKSDVQDSVPGE